jgi:hypothetical protein
MAVNPSAVLNLEKGCAVLKSRSLGLLGSIHHTERFRRYLIFLRLDGPESVSEAPNDTKFNL